MHHKFPVNSTSEERNPPIQNSQNAEGELSQDDRCQTTKKKRLKQKPLKLSVFLGGVKTQPSRIPIWRKTYTS